jgi:hypothetical protein
VGGKRIIEHLGTGKFCSGVRAGATLLLLFRRWVTSEHLELRVVLSEEKALQGRDYEVSI